MFYPSTSPLKFFPFSPADPVRSTALQEAKRLCRCIRVSADGVKWRDSSGQWQTATWDEVDRGGD